MKLKVWSIQEAASSDPNQLFILLEKDDKDNDIYMLIVDKDKKVILGGNILTIDQDHKCFILSNGVNPIIPLKTDFDDMVITVTEHEMREKQKELFHNHMMKHIFKDQAEQESQQSSKH